MAVFVPPFADLDAAAAAWRDHRIWLSVWTGRHLVNREDAFARYLPSHLRTGDDKMRCRKKRLAPAVLQRHFAGYDVGDLVALYAISTAGTSKFGVVDVDLHGPDDPARAARNATYAWLVHDRARSLGFASLLLDSNGAGGFHVYVLFGRPVPSEDAFNFMRWLVRDRTTYGQDDVETFPKQPRLRSGGYGNPVRLFGRHHTRPVWTRVWNGVRWLEGEAAVRLIYWTNPSPVPFPEEAVRYVEPPPPGATPRYAIPPGTALIMGPRPPAAVGGSTPVPRPATPSVGERVPRYLAKVEPAVAGARGDAHTIRAAFCFFRAFPGLSPAEACPYVLEWNLRCQPPWPEERLWDKVSRAAAAAATR